MGQFPGPSCETRGSKWLNPTIEKDPTTKLWCCGVHVFEEKSCQITPPFKF